MDSENVMPQLETGLFTAAVFQDVAWAEKGLGALKRKGLLAESLSVLARDTPEVAALIEREFGSRGDAIDVKNLGASRGRGPLLTALQGKNGLSEAGMAGSMARVGFQSHDCRIFETLVARGGVLVAIHSEPLAADALAVLHSYGGGNAAIGAWRGRV
jgi:hypothetical protein